MAKRRETKLNDVKPVTKKPKAHKQSKQELIDEAVELLGKIEKAEKAVTVAEIEWDAKKEAAKTAKGVWLTRVSAMRDLARTRDRWAAERKKQPLLAAAEKQAKKEETQSEAAAGAQDWRLLPVSEIVQGAALGKLLSASIETLGTLQARMLADPQWHKSIGGIGAETAGEINEAFGTFQIAHPEWFAANEVAQSAAA